MLGSLFGGFKGRITYDIFIDSIVERPTSSDSTGFTYVGDDDNSADGPNSTGGDRFVYMGFYDSATGDFSTGQTLQLEANNRAVDVTPADSLSYDTWYTITIDIDVAGGTYDVTVDDTNGTDT